MSPTAPVISDRARWVDLALGLSLLGWAMAGLLRDEMSVVRVTISLLNGGVGALFLLRTKALLHGSPRALMAALPSLALAGVAFRVAPAGHTWSATASWLFALGGGLALTSFAYLGRSFAVLPALRAVVVRGPYRVVRHPAYLGEVLMVAACAFTAGGWALALVPATALFIGWRIHAEEQLLSAVPSYRRYRERVGRRLVPFVW